MFRLAKDSYDMKKKHEIEEQILELKNKQDTFKNITKYFEEYPPEELPNGQYSFILTEALIDIINEGYCDKYKTKHHAFLNMYFSTYDDDLFKYKLFRRENTIRVYPVINGENE